MIYDRPISDAPIDQGDIIVECPLVRLASFDPENGTPLSSEFDIHRVVVLTQTCDLANEKATTANVAEVYDAQFLVDEGLLKSADVKGPVRSGRVWGWYFLPAAVELGVPEMI